MKISKEEVLYVANLARLDIDAAAVEKLTGQIGNILDYVDQLKQVDTTGITPTTHAVPLTNAFREDLEKPHLDRDAALANAPQPENGFFVVPKVVGEPGALQKNIFFNIFLLTPAAAAVKCNPSA
jgi:aspartyl-tRNA(Asn)/glutamyl-tRNA(Gln) amidotransferase subunit C